MSGPSEDKRRIEELLRINAELGAELRHVVASGSPPRGAATPTARRLSRLVEERDGLAAELEASKAELTTLQASAAELRQNLEAQHLQIGLLQSEVARLRTGFRGLGRRLRARLLHRPRG